MFLFAFAVVVGGDVLCWGRKDKGTCACLLFIPLGGLSFFFVAELNRCPPTICRFDLYSSTHSHTLHTRVPTDACLSFRRVLYLFLAPQEFQRVLTDFQGCEEQLVSEAQDGMRKHVVFESSSLANQQYDLQMLFKVTTAVLLLYK